MRDTRNKWLNMASVSREPKQNGLTFIDLFCGCGGFTLGMRRAGFECLAAIDFDAKAMETFKGGNPNYFVTYPLEKDLTQFPPSALAKLTSHRRVDVIVGGPPCQGFSTARQVDGANHGSRLKSDSRRSLYSNFLDYVDHFKPLIFVMENVVGIRTAAGGEYFTRVQDEARRIGEPFGYRVHSQVEDASALGVPQKRRRQLIIGVRADLPGYFPSRLKPARRAIPKVPLGIAIGDLPSLRAGEGRHDRPYDTTSWTKHIATHGKAAQRYLFDVLEVDWANSLTGHVARPHNERDLRDFKLLREGESSAVAMKVRNIEFEFPYDKSSFKDRYTRQSRTGPCSTIVAHLSKDGLMFIHPTQNRSLTPREAARIQGFPDWYNFPKARTHAFRLIGNAVPPLVAESIGNTIQTFLSQALAWRATATPLGLPKTFPTLAKPRPLEKPIRSRIFTLPGLPIDGAAVKLDLRKAAQVKLEQVASLNAREMRTLSKIEFLRAWHALLFLVPELHPDSALDHDLDRTQTTDSCGPTKMEIKHLSRRHARSGWPIPLDLLGAEAWRRFRADAISSEEFYCLDSQLAALNLGTHINLVSRRKQERC